MNKKKGKYRFNVIDFLLVAVILISVVAIGFLVYNDKKSASEEEMKKVKVMYILEDEAVDDILRSKIDIGNHAYTMDGKIDLGEVVDIEYSDSEYRGFDPEKNQSFTAVHPGMIDIRVVISAEATVDSDGVYYINGEKMNMGTELDVRFPYYTGSLVCVSVSEVNE